MEQIYLVASICPLGGLPPLRPLAARSSLLPAAANEANRQRSGRPSPLALLSRASNRPLIGSKRPIEISMRRRAITAQLSRPHTQTIDSSAVATIFALKLKLKRKLKLKLKQAERPLQLARWGRA